MEQEAQVNRLLNMIRLQQIQNQQNPGGSEDAASSTGATFDSSSTTTRARSPGVASVDSRFRREGERGLRASSRASSTRATGSPALGPVGAVTGVLEEGHWNLGGSRDEASFYMAETQMLVRENEMLKKRVRELERQVTELSTSTSTSTLSLEEGKPAGSAAEGMVHSSVSGQNEGKGNDLSVIDTLE